MLQGPSFHPGMAASLHAWDRIEEQVHALAGGAGQLLAHQERAWASATFQGSRHHLTFGFDGADEYDAGKRMCDQLPAHPFSIRGHSVVGAKVVSREGCQLTHYLVADVELLLLDDA